MTACDDCLRRTDLIAAIAGRLEIEFKQRTAPARVLALARRRPARRSGRRRTSRGAIAGSTRPAARARASRARLVTVCRCRDAYPERLLDLADPPAVLHVLGDPGVLGGRGRRRDRRRAARVVLRARRRALARPRPVGGAGRASSPGSRSGSTRRRTPARSRRRADRSACWRRARTSPYPARGWRLHAAVAARGAVISEMPPGAQRLPVVLHRPQPHHRRARRRDRRRPGHRALRLAHDRRLRRRARPRRRRRPGPGHEPAVRRHARADPGGRAADRRRGRRARAARRRHGPRVRASREPPPPELAPPLAAPARRDRGRPRHARRARRDARRGPRRAGRPGRARAARPVRRGFAGRWERAA